MVLSKKKNLLIIGITILLLISIFCGCFEEKEKYPKGKETIDIQRLIDKAESGDTIYISSGIYHENITIDKKLTIIGENKKTTIIDGDGGENVIFITADHVELTNFTIRNSGGYLENAGIKVDSDNNMIKNCVIYRTKTGIFIDGSKNNIISNCKFHTNGEGVYCPNSLKNTVINSEFHHNAFGLHIFSSDETTIKNSYIHTNGIGIYARESENLEITQNAIADNNQDGGGIWLFNCKNNKISNCNIDHNGAGIKLKNSDSETTYCNFYYNMFNTIRLKDSNDVVITNCNIKESFRSAIFIQNSNCEINNNNFENNLLYSIESDRNSNIDAKNNWWGHKRGPALTELGLGDKISIRLNNIKIYPKSKNQISNIGSNWETDDVFTKSEYDSIRFNQIIFEETDTDSDGLPDWWEDKWGYDKDERDDHSNLDPDGDALNNFEECFTDEYGSNPFFKDIFVEVDWVKSQDSEETNKLPSKYINEAVKIFKDHEINLHIDIGNLDGGEEIPISSTSTCADLRDIYWDYFLHNNLDNPRKGIFHYATIMNDNEETYGGFVFVGWDNLDTMALCNQRMKDMYKLKEPGLLIIYGIIHELGHQMGLIIDDFGGIDNTQSAKYVTLQALKYSNYKSCINYKYYPKILDYSDGNNGKNDFDDWGNLDFSFFKNTHFEWPIN